MAIFAHIIGWIGTSFVIIAYILVSAKKVTPTSNTYQLMNLLGAGGVGVNVWYQGAWPSVALQIVWGIIAVVSLVKTRKK